MTPSSRFFLGISAVLLSLVYGGTMPAQANEYNYAATHLTDRSVDDVLSVLTAYGEICREGCKYYGPDVKEFIQLPYKKEANSWFTWTWVSTSMKDVKYFSRVTVTKKPDGSVNMVTHQLDEDLEQDKPLIEELEKQTGKTHNPAIDGDTIFSIQKTEGGKTQVVQDIRLNASGMVNMFGGRIRDGMKDGTAATFKNIEAKK